VTTDDFKKTVPIVVPEFAGATYSNYRELLLKETPLLDVRAPVEFLKGSFPSSNNLPLMNDEERHLVGLKYKEEGQSKAIELGAKVINPRLRNERIRRWKAFIDKNPNAVLYCFRGGLRSRISQRWLKEAGVDIPLLSGGYKALRSYVLESLEKLSRTFAFTIIGGRTGNGKTLLINRLGNSVDLEKLADHRGSSFGSLVTDQPSNIDFENALCAELLRFEDAGVDHLFLEDEARLIGRVCIPDVFRNAMQQAPIVILECDLDTRIRNCFDDYVPDLLSRYIGEYGEEKGFFEYSDHHRQSLYRIRKRFGSTNYQQASELLNKALDQHENHADLNSYDEFIAFLLTQYYDPMYDYQLSKKSQRIAFSGTFEDVMKWVSDQ